MVCELITAYIDTLAAEAIDKISALESELARLKAQIAVYALSEVSNIPAGNTMYVSFSISTLP